MSLDLLSTASTGTDSKSLLNQSVSSLQTRFFTQELLKCLSACWLTAIAGGIVWCLIQPLLLATPGSDYRLSVIGGLLLLGSAFAFILAWKRTPKKGVVSLALDQALDLKERVTTAYLLSDKESSTVVGQALIEDVNERLTTLSLTEHFPIRLPEWGYLLPLLAVGFGLAWHYIPPLSTRRLVDLAQKDQAAVISEETREKVKEKLQTRKPTQSAGNKSNEKSQELQEFEAQREKLAQSKMETKEDAVDLVKQMTSLEEQMQKQAEEMRQKMQQQQGGAPAGAPAAGAQPAPAPKQ